MVVCLFVLLQLCLILAYFFNWSPHRAEKDAFKEKIIRCTAWDRIAQPLKYSYSADLLDLQKCIWPKFLLK